MGYDNVLFNGKSMRNAIITKLSEDKHLTSALFANSNVTILIDIISYMYQCLMSNLRQAASESMWSDTILYENAARLAKLIGYYAKGQMPYTLLAKIVSETDNKLDFGKVEFGYGPYKYNFAVVEHNVNNNKNLLRLALGDWNMHQEKLVSDGTKFQEFVIAREIDRNNTPSFISQKYVRVFTQPQNQSKDLSENVKGREEWTYSSDPLFLLPSAKYEYLNADDGGAVSRTIEVTRKLENSKFFNFYINENGDYVLKFGDGLSTAIPKKGDEILVMYVLSNETDKTITPSIKSAIANSSDAKIQATPFYSSIENANVRCIPFTMLDGYRDRDTAESIRRNSKSSFSRQNRLVTKEDYRSFILENYSEWKDVTVQNNWEYVSSFYGWLYAICKENKEDAEDIPEKYINPNNLKKFNSSDLADANNIYIWVLDKSFIDANSDEIQKNIGIRSDLISGDSTKFGNSIGAIKDITVQPIFLNAICKRFMPYALHTKEDLGKLNYDNPYPFNSETNIQNCFRIHIDSNYANSYNIIKSKTYSLIKSYLFDNIALGYTPNIPSLIKDLMSIDGVINITTVYNEEKDNPKTEIEINGMQFCTWTDTNSEVFDPKKDAKSAFNLPNIPCFQFFKSAQTYDDFINKALDFKVDYSITSK